VAGEQRQIDLGKHRVAVADDARKELLVRLEQTQEIGTNLFLDRARDPAAVTQILEGDWLAAC